MPWCAELQGSAGIEPLNFCHVSSRFPELASMAKAYLCVPATEVPSERAFSMAGLTVTKLRASLDPETVDHVCFIHKNNQVELVDECNTDCQVNEVKQVIFSCPLFISFLSFSN